MRAKAVLCLSVSLLLWFTAGSLNRAAAQAVSATSPVGRWRTVDDVSGKVKSVVTIELQNGKLVGSVAKLLDPDPNNPAQPCVTCTGKLKGKSLVGVRILWDMKQVDDSWSGGFIMDPKTDSVYRCTMTVEDGGKKLKVRGFIGISLLGRTQFWYREE
jgi:uncharacterized protein (DUF2147 family)